VLCFLLFFRNLDGRNFHPLLALYGENADTGEFKFAGHTPRGDRNDSDPRWFAQKGIRFRMAKKDRQIRFVVYDMDPDERPNAKGIYELDKRRIMGETSISLHEFFRKTGEAGLSAEYRLEGRGLPRDCKVVVTLAEMVAVEGGAASGGGADSRMTERERERIDRDDRGRGERDRGDSRMTEREKEREKERERSRSRSRPREDAFKEYTLRLKGSCK
jgi:hypothetical protein